MPSYTADEEPRREEVFCGIEVMRIDAEKVDPHVTHLVTLMLPVPVRTFEIKPDIIAGPCSPHPDPRTPFSCDPASRIVVIDLGKGESFVAPCILVPQRTPIALAEKYDAEADRPVKIPREEWSPQTMRVLETARSDACPRAVR
ncbi:hypothetical protein EWM64_g10713 [Hericium alpestre]|uniref:Uncharacterized protein n=1 Tax=Hericium alpestre TaxID=135208 RepID=A0A4Y9ZIM3_9AGAM|nr:hypothetical protein EWM64_g10713 [Hericium alpestre]